MTDEIERQLETVRAELEPLAHQLRARERLEAETLTKLRAEKQALTQRASQIEVESPQLEERRIVAQNAVASLARGRLDKVMGALYSVLAVSIMASLAGSWAVFGLKQLVWQGVVAQLVLGGAGFQVARVIQRRKRRRR